MDSHCTADNNDTAHSNITDTTTPSSSHASTDCVQKNTFTGRTFCSFSSSGIFTVKKKNQISSEDTLTNFLISMAQTLKTFPLRDQIEIKGK
jgi:hypothetical protein